MGRPFKNVAVIKAYDAKSQFVCEDIVPMASFDNAGSILLNVADVRAARGIRFISFRLFDASGNRIQFQSMSYDLKGEQVRHNYRMPDGTIIEDPNWV